MIEQLERDRLPLSAQNLEERLIAVVIIRIGFPVVPDLSAGHEVVFADFIPHGLELAGVERVIGRVLLGDGIVIIARVVQAVLLMRSEAVMTWRISWREY